MIRLILILLIVFLIVRIFIGWGATGTTDKNQPDASGSDKKTRSGVPKGIGEYVDFEEVKKKGK
jgi:hypothetical protein